MATQPSGSSTSASPAGACTPAGNNSRFNHSRQASDSTTPSFSPYTAPRLPTNAHSPYLSAPSTLNMQRYDPSRRSSNPKGTAHSSQNSYAETFAHINKYLLAQWANVFAPSRVSVGDRATIAFHDYDSDGVNIEPVANHLGHTLDMSSDSFVFAEDLSSSLIDKLGSTFHILPDMFEQHLYNSGYRGSYNDMDPKQWRTAHVSKDYVSLRWFSVVTRRRLLRDTDIPQRESPWGDLLTEGKIEGKSLLGIGEVGSSKWVLNIDSATFRPAWELMPKQGLVAWEERATISIKKHGSAQHTVLLLDPLPFIRSEDDSVRDPKRLCPIEARASPRHPHYIDISDWQHVRSNVEAYATPCQSTYEDIRSWLKYWRAQTEPSNPVVALFEIVRVDTLNLIALLDSILREIIDSSCVEEHLRQNVDDWRKLLNVAQDELPRLSRSIREFFGFLEKEQKCPSTLNERIQVLDQEVFDLSTRVGLAKEVVHAELALMNSMKSIAEAENVKRLTELAFFFIPMAFSAALFSIQVREFQENPPPAWAFVITALSLVILAYCARVLQKSCHLRRWKDELVGTIRRFPRVIHHLFWDIGRLILVSLAKIGAAGSNMWLLYLDYRVADRSRY